MKPSDRAADRANLVRTVYLGAVAMVSGNHRTWRAVMAHVRALLVCAFWLTWGVTSAAAQCGEWGDQRGYPGVTGAVNAMCSWDPDGPLGPQQESLIVGGSITAIGDTVVHNMASWDGAVWTDMNPGGGPIFAACVVDGSLVIANRSGATGTVPIEIRRRDQSGWVVVGRVTAGSVNAMCECEGSLVIGGNFTSVDGTQARGVARWDGTWHALGSGIAMAPGTGAPAGTAQCLAVVGSDLVVGGAFMDAGGISTLNIARWDGAEWHAFGTGRPNTVFSIGSLSGEPIAADMGVWRWSGAQWSNLVQNSLSTGGIISNADADDVYVFTSSQAPRHITPSGVSYLPPITARAAVVWRSRPVVVNGGSRIVELVNGAWQSIAGDGLLFAPTCVASVAGELVVTAQQSARIGIPGAWRAIQTSGGIAEAINDVVSVGSTIYFTATVGAGEPWNAGKTVARLDGDSVTPIGMPAWRFAGSPVAYQGALWVTAYSGDYNRHLFRWDGASWSAVVTTGLGETCHLAVEGDNLYLTGTFTDIDGVPVRNIARFDGVAWHAMGTGVGASSPVWAAEGHVFVGDSDNFGDLRMWDGQAWIVPFAASGYPTKIVGYHGDAVVMGMIAPGVQGGMFRWNGTSDPTPLGLDEPALADTPSDACDLNGKLWVVGAFRSAGGVPAGFVASWTDSAACDCDSIDFNRDGLFPDITDIPDFLSVFQGGNCTAQPPTAEWPCNSDIDFNNDGLSPDTLDIQAFLSVFSGGPCLQ